MVLTALGACTQIDAPDTMDTMAPAMVDDPNDLTIAFIGDQGLGADARAVLELIRAEGRGISITKTTRPPGTA